MGVVGYGEDVGITWRFAVVDPLTFSSVTRRANGLYLVNPSAPVDAEARTTDNTLAKMRKIRGLLLWLPTCLTVVFVVLMIARSSTELLGSALPVVEKHGSLGEQEEPRADDRWIARNQVKSNVKSPVKVK